MAARDKRYGVAIDGRLESAVWMRDFEAKPAGHASGQPSAADNALAAAFRRAQEGKR